MIAALVWGLITYFTNFTIGYFAVAVGFFVGIAVKKYGRGSGRTYGIIGGVYALAYSGAFRIAKNPLPKDELDYLLQAKPAEAPSVPSTQTAATDPNG